MSLGQLNIWGKDKVEVAIQRLKEFEPKEGYYLAFSGGKDSVCIYYLAKMAGVKFDAHYNITTVDPPELYYFIRDQFPDVERHKPEKNMWSLIPENLMPPTRTVRYCCRYLKEGGGMGRFVITGVRWAESSKRKNTRADVEYNTYGSKSKKAIKERQIFLNSDNDEKRRMIEQCESKSKHIINPIVDWTDREVWEFIDKYNLPYCKLYDEGFKRLGCIACPISGKKGMERDFKRWPSFKKAYLRAFGKMIAEREKKGIGCDWKTPDEVMNWWIYGKGTK